MIDLNQTPQQEFHVTVASVNVVAWIEFCLFQGIKPLWIELNNFERQLMCAARTDPSDAIRRAGWRALRFKREVRPVRIDTTIHCDDKYLTHPTPAVTRYYECHVKLDGPFEPAWHLASRDLLREHRWYLTHRSIVPFDPNKFVDLCRLHIHASVIAGWEYEAAVQDTNECLDSNWTLTNVGQQMMYTPLGVPTR